jgi:hypothetical protein
MLRVLTWSYPERRNLVETVSIGVLGKPFVPFPAFQPARFRQLVDNLF